MPAPQLDKCTLTMNFIHSKFRSKSPRLFQNMLVLLLCMNLSGCITSVVVIEPAKTRRFVDENGEVVMIEKGQSEMYWWLPLTIPADIIVGVFWGAIESLTSDDSSDDFSPKKTKKLKLSR